MFLSVFFLGCSKKNVEPDPVVKSETPSDRTEKVEKFPTESFAPLPDPETLSPAQVALGKKLFNDVNLSKSKKISCNSCHGLESFGVDNKPTSPGHEGQLGGRNSPSVYNAFLHIAQFWDGRSPDVEDQAKGPILNPIEMAMPGSDDVVAELNMNPDYQKEFKEAFPEESDPITFDNYAKAVGAFERTLLSPSRWDTFLKGDHSVFNEQEKRGLKTFVQMGCATCHNGATVGGAMYQKAGLVHPWPNQKDLGRFEVTKQEADKMMFKVPSLRNIEKTGPYFHDGSVASLDQAVEMMAWHQLGQKISEADRQDIVAWLKTLTGEIK